MSKSKRKPQYSFNEKANGIKIDEVENLLVKLRILC